jgi:hypothetical protein
MTQARRRRLREASDPAVEATAITVLRRQYPHVDEIDDWRAQQSVRLLWDRVFDLEERLSASQGTISDLVAQANTADQALQKVEAKADDALAIAQRPEDSTDIEGSEGAGESLPGGGDDGQGQAGLGDAGANGDIDVAGDFSAYNAGKIVGGVANEFPDLLLATAPSENGDTAAIEARRANGEELVRRCIWHLQEAGFTAGRQLNPSGILSNTRLCVVVDSGVADPPTYTREYDLFLAHGVYWEDMTMQMSEGPGAHLVDDAGIPD